MIEARMSDEVRTNRSVLKSLAWTAFTVVLSIPILLTLLFPVAAYICSFIESVFRLSSKNEGLILDAVVSFILVCIFFFTVLSVPRIFGRFVVVFCAIFMFLLWGVENEFFWKGFNPLYPGRYEVDMALNEMVAASFMIFLKKHTTGATIDWLKRSLTPVASGSM